MTSSLRRAAIIGGARIPFARSNTAYAETSNQEMLTAALKSLVERHGLKGAGRGLISICTAGGIGVTAILER